MDHKNNKSEVIVFRIDLRLHRALIRLMEAEERPGVSSINKYVRALAVDYAVSHGKKQAQLEESHA